MKKARHTRLELHPYQYLVFKDNARFKLLVCGRRWGKTSLAIAKFMEQTDLGNKCAYLAPNYDDFIKPFYNELYNACHHLLDLNNCRKGKFMSFKKGGTVDFYSSNSINAGRGRKFHFIVIDEGGHSTTVGYLEDLWERALRPTLVDYKGSAVIMGTPTGNKNYFYSLSNRHDWAFYQAPTSSNPMMSIEELEEIKNSSNELVWKQEYLAEFVDWDESAFFNWNHFKIIENDVNYDYVYITCDTALKGGMKHDGTAYCVWGIKTKQVGFNYTIENITLLDWDIFNLDGNMIESKLIPIIETLKEKHSNNFKGIFIEDKVSGTMILQSLREKYGNLIKPLGEKYLGHKSKGERAIACSNFASCLNPDKRKVYISKYADEKEVMFKNELRNHLKDQISTFSITALVQADDLVDAFCYGVLVAFYKD